MTRLFVITVALLFLAVACDSGVRMLPKNDKDTVAGTDDDQIVVADDIYPDDVQTDDNISDDPTDNTLAEGDPEPPDLSDVEGVEGDGANDDTVDETVDDPLPDDATDDTTDDATDDTVDDPITDDPIVDDTVDNDITDGPLPDDVTTDDTLPDDTTDTPPTDDMVDDTTTDDQPVIDEDTITDDTPLPDEDTTVDTTAPTILGTLPQDEATGIPVDTTIEIAFSEPLDTEGLADSFEFTLNTVPVTMTFAWRSDDNTVVLTPDALLTPGATYTVTVKTTLTDLAGNPLEAEYLFEFTISLCGNGIPELGEQCDLGVGNGNCALCTTLCVDKPANFCGDGFICDSEQCETGQTATCAAALSDANAVGTAPCNGTCGGYTTASNCTRTFSCAAKPDHSSWNTVDHYTQTWNGTAWTPADSATAHNTTASTTACRFVCNTNYNWDGTACVAATRTYTCTAKPQTVETTYNTVPSYTQTWSGSAWTPADDATTEYNATASTESCRYKCAAGYVWNDIQCVVLPPECGDSAPDTGEDCDDGNTVNADACKNDCTFNTCGDNVAGGSLPALIYTFENGGSMPTSGVTNGSPGWAISTTQKHAGTYSARSSSIGNNATATITFTGLSDGEICYWRAGSSEFDYDFFTVTIDSVQKESLSGMQQTWTRVCWAVTPGETHSIVFRYAKDTYVADDWDAWYIDDLSFSDGGTEECDDGNAVNTDACKNNCTNNICGDGVVLTDIETCDTVGMACATLLSIPAATGTAPCNDECTGYIPVGNCAKTNTCPAKPAAGTSWNTVASYAQSWNGTAWVPVDDTSTTYNATGSTTECRYTCAFNWTWDGTACVTTDFLAETIGQISEQNMTDTVYYLASSSCDGRNNNTTGSTNARNYLIAELTAAGVEAGGAGGAWTQSFSNYWCNSGLRTGTNVVGYIEGSDPTLKNEFVVIGGHYDHLGHTGSTFYPGADDNASGVAMMVEVAAAFKRIQSHLARSVIFIGFDAEEDGLCGSNYYNDNPLFPLNDTVYMIDLDMVGYLRNNAVELTDSNGSTWGNTMLSTLADKYGLTESFEDCGYACSDHAPFYDSGIPSVMITTGLEDVYHETGDTANLVSYDGMVTLTGYVTEFAYEVNVHTDPFLYFAPFEAPRIWQPREFRDHGVTPLE